MEEADAATHPEQKENGATDANGGSHMPNLMSVVSPRISGDVTFGSDITQEHTDMLKTILQHQIKVGENEDVIEESMALFAEDINLARQTLRNLEHVSSVEKEEQEGSDASEHEKEIPTDWPYDRLKTKMKNLYKDFIFLVNGRERHGWTSLDIGDSQYKMWERESEVSGEDKPYILKIQAQMDVDPLKVMQLVRESDGKKRMRWDSENLCQINVTSQGRTVAVPGIRLLRCVMQKNRTDVPLHRKFEIVESFIKAPSGLGLFVSTRRYLISQWTMHNAKDKEIIILSHSIDDRRYPCPADVVDATGFGGFRIVYDDTMESCHVTMVTHICPHGNIPSNIVKWGKQQLLKLMKKIHKNCQDSAYREIYGDE